MRTLLVHQGEKPLIGILEDGQLAEVFFPQEGDTAEAVLLGRVERIVPGMKAAFVDIGQEKNGFLPLEEKNTGLSYPKTGDAVIVQIRKEAQGVKGAFLTRDISLCGETMLLTPMSRMIGVSSKITEDGKRKALKETGRDCAGALRLGDAHGGGECAGGRTRGGSGAAVPAVGADSPRRADRACAVRLDAAAKHARSRAG